ncbi:GNAT family N-acetyltransferase [Leifsonia sp. NPDC080035]|uniref:GNAT family N-acetyltransferase n=1 Tax=Leifsonia sp. NPDC080035 TaxID=3143936 RepID=A0AAU7GF10_9MICO
MTPTGSAFEYPDEAGYPDGVGTLTQDQTLLIQELADDERTPDFSFAVVDDEAAGAYTAIVGDTAIGGIPYSVVDDERLVLLATSVLPEFRHQGVATELIRRVLDDLRSRRKRITVMCPIVSSFIQRNPGYADLIDGEHPGVGGVRP